MYILIGEGLGKTSIAINVRRAIEQNRRYSTQLEWYKFYDRINSLLGFTNYSPNEETFAQAVADWQQKQDLKSDGIIGRNTWSQMQKLIGLMPAPISPAPISPATSMPTGNMPQGTFGTLTILAPKHYRFSYTFTPEDALWLARLIVGEAGGYDNLDNHAVIWSVFNRFGLFTHAGSYWMKKANMVGYKTLAAFVQSYSTTLQPVLNSVKAAIRAIEMSKKQPHRFQYIETGGFYLGTTVPKGQLKHHRDRIQKMKWSSLKSETQQVVEKALKGKISSPTGLASEFANTYTYFKQSHQGIPPKDVEQWRQYTEQHAKNKKWAWIGEAPDLHQMKENAFFIDNRVKNLPLDTVRVIPPV